MRGRRARLRFPSASPPRSARCWPGPALERGKSERFLGEALLDAHVAYESSRLRGDALATLIHECVAAAFAWLEEVKLDQVITPERIIGVIQRYAIQLRISGGITESAGEMANVVFSSKVSGATRVGDMFSASSYKNFAKDRDARGRSARAHPRSHPERGIRYAHVACGVAHRTRPGLPDGRSAERVPMLKDSLIALGRRAFPDLGSDWGARSPGTWERHAARFTRDGEKHLLQAVDREWVRQMADEIWDVLSKKPLADATTALTSRDLEDFIVLGYEFWLKFRKTPYFLAVVTDVVQHLFEKYGDESLASLILDMGVTEAMIASELRIFLSPILDHASRTGFLERGSAFSSRRSITPRKPSPFSTRTAVEQQNDRCFPARIGACRASGKDRQSMIRQPYYLE